MTAVSGKSRKDPRPDDFSYPEFRAPEMTPQRLDHMAKAAKAYADRHASDPFTYNRIMLYMRRGIMNPDEVIADSRMASPREESVS